MPDVVLGQHLLIEFGLCSAPALDDLDGIRAGLLAAARRSGATVIGEIFHRFSPQGVTGVVAIAESHVSIHTWPEHGYAAVDVFTCSERMRSDVIVEDLRELLEAGHVVVRRVERGPRGEGQN